MFVTRANQCRAFYYNVLDRKWASGLVNAGHSIRMCLTIIGK